MINLNDVFGVWGREAVLETGVDCDTQALDLVLHLNMEWDFIFEFGFWFSFFNLDSDFLFLIWILILFFGLRSFQFVIELPVWCCLHLTHVDHTLKQKTFKFILLLNEMLW